MRTFTIGPASDRKTVVIELTGRRINVVQRKPDGSVKQAKKELTDEAEARTECARMVGELLSSGYVERGPGGARIASPAVKPAAKRPEPDGPDLSALYEEDDATAGEAASLLPRLGPAPGPAAVSEEKPKKKKKKAGGKSRKGAKGGGDDGLDKRVIAAVAAVAVACLAGIGYVVYDGVLKPPSIVGHWEGSQIDFEIGKPIVQSQYRLVLDEQKRASLTLQEKFTEVGTYDLKGDRLSLALKSEPEPGEEKTEGAAEVRQYKVALGRATLDLFDPESGKKLVQLIRFRKAPAVGGGTTPPAAPRDVASGADDKADVDADARLASVEFAPKDGAFKLRHPPGWTPDTGSRSDNTYSWAKFTKGSAKVTVYADVAGSLMSGSDSAGQYEKGSELAPVHRAHELYKRTAEKEYSDYKEGPPTLFEGSRMGEGRIATFTASGGLFAGTLRGYRLTLLTNDRRISLFCECPEGEFKALKPTFLAVCRSLSR